jgi:hypothetical protein
MTGTRCILTNILLLLSNREDNIYSY